MSNRTKKYLWPASFVMSLALVGVLAAFLAIAMTGSNSAEAHGPCDLATMTVGDFATCVATGGDDPTHTHPTDPGNGGGGTPPATTGTIESSSKSPNSSLKLVLTIANPGTLMPGSSIELFLEDDFQVGDLDQSKVYFIGKNAGRVYVTDPIVVDDDDHFKGGDDYAIQVFVPDMNPGNDDGFTTWSAANAMGLKLVFDKAGIQNPSEETSNSWGFSVLPPGADNNKAPVNVNAADQELPVYAKISLSDEDNGRGYELTVTGSGFNNGVDAGLYVLSQTEKPSCAEVIGLGTRVGAGTVGSDDKVVVTFPVTVPTFMPGDGNWLCMIDGEGRDADTDVEQFELEPSISVSPATANVGDTVTVFAQDFMANDPEPLNLKLINVSSTDMERGFPTSGGNIGADGSGTATFEVPGWAEGTLRLDAWGENTKITIIGSSLNISKSEALPNELLTITGDGFGGNNVAAADVTIDGVALHVHADSLKNGMIEVSSSGQFVASVILWPEKRQTANPTLTAGVHTIKVKDDAGFSGTVTVTIPEPTIKVVPEVAGPRDIVTISGENWPIENLEGGNVSSISLKVSDGGRDREYSVYADSAGRFFQEHQVHSGVTIPSTSRVEGKYSDLVKLTTYDVPASIIEVSPAMGQPGGMVGLMVDKMPVYSRVSSVEIAGRNVMPVGNFSTDRTGSVSVEGVVIPGLDPGIYSVLLKVNDTVAIGSLEVLAEGPIGTEMPVAEALMPLGDMLEAVFFFDNVSKTWSFYDPRPEFAELNTLSDLVAGEAYWVLVTEDVDDVVLNNKSRSLSCAGDDCWNLVIW